MAGCGMPWASSSCWPAANAASPQWVRPCCGGPGNRHVPPPQEGHRTQAPLRHRAALLGHAAPARPVFVPLRPHHHGICGIGGAQPLLPRSGHRTAVLRAQCGRLAHPPGDALPQRRGRGGSDRDHGSVGLGVRGEGGGWLTAPLAAAQYRHIAFPSRGHRERYAVGRRIIRSSGRCGRDPLRARYR
jgi:hypothetical protein